MNKVKIYLNSFERVSDFIKLAETINCRMKLYSGNFVVDGKSILGIFALDLTKAIEVIIYNDRQGPHDYPTELEEFM